MDRRIWVVTALVLAGCVSTPQPTRPMASTAEPAERRADTLLIFLPGRGDRGPDFVERGFFETGAGRGYDMLAADAHFGYYTSGTIVDRLHEDIVQPARSRGYRHVWLLGISAGGMGAGLYAHAHPDMVDGVILLAPYPGDGALVRAIADAGGLAAWSDENSADDTGAGRAFERRHWRWLGRVTGQTDGPAIVLGYGRDDRFAEAAGLLAERLPARRVFRAQGGHRWPVWRGLWRRIAAAGYPTTDGP